MKSKEVVWIWTPLGWPLAFLCGSAVLSASVGRDFGFHPHDLIKAVGLPLILPLVATVVTARPAWSAEAARFFLGGLGLHGFYALIRWGMEAAERGKFGVQARGAFGMNLTYAEIMGMGLLFFIGSRWKEKEGKIQNALLAAGILSFVLTFARGAYIGLGAGILALVSVRKPRWFLPGLGAAVVLFGLWAASGALIPEGRGSAFWRKVLSPLSQESFSNRARVDLAFSGLRMIQAHPLGVGPGNVYEALPLFKVEDPGPWGKKWSESRFGHLHNDILQTAAERGLPGLAAWIWLAVLLLSSFTKRSRAGSLWAPGCLAAVVFFLACGLTEYTLGDSEVAMVFWFLAGLGLAL